MTKLFNRQNRLTQAITTCALMLVCGWSAAPAQAATFTVSNLNDSGVGSLRQAVTDAVLDGSVAGDISHYMSSPTTY